MSMLMDFTRKTAMQLKKDNHCVIHTVDPENIFTFPDGLLGFEETKDYCFMINDRLRPFMFMQALDDSNQCFVCVETCMIHSSYKIAVPEESVRFLDIKKPAEAMVLSMVTVRKNVEDITANLRSPIILNMRNLRGQQVILTDCRLPVRFRIWDTISKDNRLTQAG